MWFTKPYDTGSLLLLMLAATALSSWACASHRAPASPSQPLPGRAAEQSIVTQLEEIAGELATLEKGGAWQKRGYFDAPENDQIEQLLFQYTTARDGLHDLAAETDTKSSKSSKQLAGSRAEDQLLAYAAALAVLDLDGRVVETFRADPVAVAKLNESFYRSEIPAGTFERLELEATAEGRIHEIERAFSALDTALAAPASELAQAITKEPALATLAEETQQRARSVDARLERLTEHGARILRRPDNLVSHDDVGKASRATDAEVDEGVRKSRAWLFKSVSRIKSPTAHLIRFDAAQKQQIRAALEPGDLLFSYTAGFASDVFIPGAFKHALVWVGTPEDRAAAGLDASRVANLTPAQQKRVVAAFATVDAPGGKSADLIEAIAEGVKFSHVDTILDTHINRFLALRPRLEAEDRTQALVEVFRYLGDGYDFRFDFADASRQVCTELVYRAYDDRGPLSYALVDRVGRKTLSADDIIRAAMGPARDAYDIVFYADEDPASKDHAARVLVGEPARQAVNAALAAVKPAPAK